MVERESEMSECLLMQNLTIMDFFKHPPTHTKFDCALLIFNDFSSSSSSFSLVRVGVNASYMRNKETPKPAVDFYEHNFAKFEINFFKTVEEISATEK